MKRQWIELDKINPYDGIHVKDGDWFDVPYPDPKDKKEHEEGIEYIKQKILDGVKIMPILVQETYNGYEKLDGFKRYMARKALGFKAIECFVCEPKDEGKEFNFDGNKLTCATGGQSYERFPLVEYDEAEEQNNGLPGFINYLYKGKSLRIELREAIHLHWGEGGRNRMLLGKRDFETLGKAIINSKL